MIMCQLCVTWHLAGRHSTKKDHINTEAAQGSKAAGAKPEGLHCPEGRWLTKLRSYPYLCYLLHVDDILGLVGVGLYDLRTAGHLAYAQPQSWGIARSQGTTRTCPVQCSATETVPWLYKAGSFHMRPPVHAQAEVAKSRWALEKKALLGYIYFA